MTKTRGASLFIVDAPHCVYMLKLIILILTVKFLRIHLHNLRYYAKLITETD